MSLPSSRVVPTLTEVLDETAWRQGPASDLVVPASEPQPPAAPSVEPDVAPMPETELLREAVQDLAPPPGALADEMAAALVDFDLDLGGPVDAADAPPPEPATDLPAATLPPDSNAFFDALELGLRQRLGLALDLAVDELLQQRLRESLERATSLLTESLLAELRQQLAPQLETLLQQALAEVLRQERDRLAR